MREILGIPKGLTERNGIGGLVRHLPLGPILGPSKSHPGSKGVPSRLAMCFVLQHFGPIHVPKWGPSQPVLVPSCQKSQEGGVREGGVVQICRKSRAEFAQNCGHFVLCIRGRVREVANVSRN